MSEQAKWGLRYVLSVTDLETGEHIFEVKTVGRHKFTDKDAVMRILKRNCDDIAAELTERESWPKAESIADQKRATEK